MRHHVIVILLAAGSLSLAAGKTSYPDANDREASPGKTVYHIDPAQGDDANDGTTAKTPWKSFHRVNALRLAAGDRVEVRPGRFDHTLSLAGEGTAENPVEVLFAPGRYEFDPVNARREAYPISNTNSDPDGLKAVGLHLMGAKHIRIHGPGAVVRARGRMMHVCMDRCEHIALEGISFDYHRPTVSEFRVAAVGDDSADLEVHGDSTHAIENSVLVWLGEGWRESGGLGQELDPVTGRVFRMRDPLGGLRIEETAPFHLRAHGRHRLKAGRIYQIRNPFRDYCGAFTRDSRDILWRNVHFRFIHGMGIVSQFSENLTFDSVRIEPDPESGRTTAAWADCIQVSGCRGRVMVRNCRFSGAHDDAINIHGTHLRVIGTDSGRREVRVRFMHEQTFGFPAFHAGDDVEFVRWDSLATYGPNRVSSAQMADPRTMVLRLENPLPAEIREKDVLENVTWTPEVEIRGCVIRHMPTRGILCTTRRAVIIEDNDFHATHMPGILIENDASGWYESGCVRDMLIRTNRFHHCGEPAIHINPRNSVANSAVHQGIRIENNTFHLKDKVAVGAKSTTGLRVTGNQIHSRRQPGDTGWFHTTDTGEIIEKDNRVVGP